MSRNVYALAPEKQLGVITRNLDIERRREGKELRRSDEVNSGTPDCRRKSNMSDPPNWPCFKDY